VLLDILKDKFGKSSNDFNNVEEIDQYVSKVSGKKLPVEMVHGDIITPRGCVLSVQEMDAGKLFDEALAKYGY